MADIKIYGKLVANTEDQVVADASSIQDTARNQKLSVTLNELAQGTGLKVLEVNLNNYLSQDGLLALIQGINYATIGDAISYQFTSSIAVDSSYNAVHVTASVSGQGGIDLYLLKSINEKFSCETVVSDGYSSKYKTIQNATLITSSGYIRGIVVTNELVGNLCDLVNGRSELTSTKLSYWFPVGVLPTHIKLANDIIIDLQGNEYCAIGSETVDAEISNRVYLNVVKIDINGDFSNVSANDVKVVDFLWQHIENPNSFSFDDLPRFSDSSDVADFPGSSGGGGSGGTTQNIYVFSLKTSTDGNPISTNNFVEMVAKISEDAFNNKFLPELNTLGSQLATVLSQTWTNITNVDEFVALETQVHSMDMTGMAIMALLVEHSLKDNQPAWAYLQDYDGGDGMLLLTASTVAHSDIAGGGQALDIPLNVLGLSNQTTGSCKDWFTNSSASRFQLYFGANAVSSLTYTTEIISTGSGSSVGGSGKLYVFNFDLTAYDIDGNVVDFSFTGSGSATSLPFEIQVYESNFEKCKTKFNQLAQMAGATINIDTPQDFANAINSFMDETVGTTTTAAVGYIVLYHLICLADKSVIKFPITTGGGATIDNFIMVESADILGNLFGWAIAGDTRIGLNGVKTEDGNQYEYIDGLNTNNSCTLTEYGTSASGGDTPSSESTGMQRWVFTFDTDVFINVYTKFSQSELASMLADTNTNIDTINTMMSISLNHISSFDDIGTLVTQSQTIDSTGALTETIIGTFMGGLCGNTKTIGIFQDSLLGKRTVVNSRPTINNQMVTNFNCVIVNDANQFVTLQIIGTNAGAGYEEI